MTGGVTELRMLHTGLGDVRFNFEESHLYTEFPLSRSYC